VIAAVGTEKRLEHVPVKGDDAALNPWLVILMDLNALVIPDSGVKL